MFYSCKITKNAPMPQYLKRMISCYLINRIRPRCGETYKNFSVVLVSFTIIPIYFFSCKFKIELQFPVIDKSQTILI